MSAEPGYCSVCCKRRDAVREYESVCEDVGMHTGLVDVATLCDDVVQVVRDGTCRGLEVP